MVKSLLIAALAACFLSIVSAGRELQRGTHCGTGWSSSLVPDSAPMPSMGGVPLCPKKPNFGPSCEKHDACYDKCGTTQEQCDQDFLTNLKKGCDEQQHSTKICSGYCSVAASLYYKAVANFGASAFANAQAKACK